MTNYQSPPRVPVQPSSANTLPPYNNAGIPLTEQGYVQQTPTTFTATTTTTTLALIVPPDPDVYRYRITNQDATNAILFTEGGYTPATVSVANCQKYYKLLIAGATYETDKPSADGLQILANAGTPNVLTEIWFN